VTSPARTAQAVYGLPSSAFNEPAYKSPGSGGILLGPDDLALLEAGLPRRGSDELMAALADLESAQMAYRRADQFYNGMAGDQHTSPRLADLLAKAGATEIEDFNYAAVPVDSVADNLIVRAVTASTGVQAEQKTVTPASPPEADQLVLRAQEAVDDLRADNELDAEEAVLHLEASKHGDAYLFVWPRTQEVDEADDTDSADELDLIDGTFPTRVTGVDMWVNTADTVRAFYDRENPLQCTHVIKSWEWSEGRVRATLYYPDRIERWVSDKNEDKANPEAWKPYLVQEGDEWPLPNPTGRIPFFHFRNQRPYGTPEHARAYGPQRLVNKLITAHMSMIDYQTFPQRYILLNPKSEDALLNMIDPDFPEDEDADVEGDGRSQFRADPAAIWKIPGGSGVGQFPPAEPGVILEPLDRYIRSMAELTKTPLDEFVGYGQALSGEARKMGRKPLTDKLRNRAKSYGATWQDAYEFALELMQFFDVTINVEWAPFETASGLEDWNVIATKITQGVPVGQALQEAGYERDVVEGWLHDETGADLTRRVTLLNAIGTAVQTLGAGVGLGVVSAPQVADIISRILGLTGEALPMLETPVEIQPPPPPPVPGAGPPVDEAEGGDKGGDAAALPPAPPPPPPFPAGQGSPGPSRE
jgi:hypothetical protein